MEEFIRTERLLGGEAMKKLAGARVAVFGVGGVGGYVVEALARSGIGALDLCDADTVALSNINRQILATHDTVGQPKVEVARARVHAIHPACIVRTYPVFYTPATADTFDFSVYDYVVDAIDTMAGKIALVLQAQAAGVPVICSMGAGNKLDPTQFEVTDIYKTTHDPLARVLRTELRRRGVRHLKVVCSREIPQKPAPAAPQDLAPGKHTSPGSVAFVPSVAGLILAGEVIKDLINTK